MTTTKKKVKEKLKLTIVEVNEGGHLLSNKMNSVAATKCPQIFIFFYNNINKLY